MPRVPEAVRTGSSCLAPTPPARTAQGVDLEKLLSISSVSSDGTRQRNLGVARQAAKKIQRDKAHAEHEAYHHHHH